MDQKVPSDDPPGGGVGSREDLIGRKVYAVDFLGGDVDVDVTTHRLNCRRYLCGGGGGDKHGEWHGQHVGRCWGVASW